MFNKKAERNISQHSFTFTVIPPYHEHTVWNIEIEHWKLYTSMLAVILTVFFSSLINEYSPNLIKALSSYQVATLEQKEYKQKLADAIDVGLVLKDRLRELRKNEAG